MSVYIIAEAGVNHNGSFDLACKLVDAAKAAGVDCIKFQTFKSKNLVSKNAQKADYQKNTTGDGSQEDMLKKLELSYDEFLKLKAYCDEKQICFLSTPFDFDSIDFLNSIDMPFWKIPSGEVTNYPYLVALAKTGKPVVMSTGMCEMTEIEAAIRVLQENGTKEIKLLHCNTEYPTPFEDVNLKAIYRLRPEFREVFEAFLKKNNFVDFFLLDEEDDPQVWAAMAEYRFYKTADELPTQKTEVSDISLSDSAETDPADSGMSASDQKDTDISDSES